MSGIAAPSADGPTNQRWTRGIDVSFLSSASSLAGSIDLDGPKPSHPLPRQLVPTSMMRLAPSIRSRRASTAMAALTSASDPLKGRRPMARAQIGCRRAASGESHSVGSGSLLYSRCMLVAIRVSGSPTSESRAAPAPSSGRTAHPSTSRRTGTTTRAQRVDRRPAA